MRWKQTQLHDGDTRIRSGFLIFPRCCGGEWRWLERATWTQTFETHYDGCEWVDTRWIEPVVVKTFEEMAVKK